MTRAHLDRERLARVLGMLGSAHDGEVLAAARQAERLRAEARLTWREIVFPAPPSPQLTPASLSVTAAIIFVLQHQHVLTPWERGFVRSIRVQKYPLSDKQMAVLEQLLNKAQRSEARAAS